MGFAKTLSILLPIALVTNCARLNSVQSEPYCSHPSKYNATLAACVLPIFADCSRTTYDEICPPNSECSDYQLACICNRKLKPGPDGLSCDLWNNRYEAPCNISNISSSSNKQKGKDDKCDVLSGLSCQNGKCVCSSKTAFWSPETTNCVEKDCQHRTALLNQRVGGYYDQNIVQTYVDPDTQLCTMALYVTALTKVDWLKDNLICCQKNAGFVSVPNWRFEQVACKCNDGFVVGQKIENQTIQCIPLKGYEEKCDAKQLEGKCDENLGLICDPEARVCTCRSERIWHKSPNGNPLGSCKSCELIFPGTFYDSMTKSCVLKIGNACEANRGPKCGENSKCNATSSQKGSCECLDGYLPDYFENSESCYKKLTYQDKCTVRLGAKYTACSFPQRLICSDVDGAGVCDCVEPLVWDSDMQICMYGFGGMCEKDDSYCARNHQCNFAAKECECNAGYSYRENRQNRKKNCLGDFGAPCVNNGDCHSETICADGKCICPLPANQVYGAEAQKCWNRVGTSCQTQTNNGTTATEVAICAKNSICSSAGICTCESGLYESGWKNCVKPFGAECAVGDCDAAVGMACIQDKCSCVDPTLKFTTKEIGCVAREGSECGLVSPAAAAAAGGGTGYGSCSENSACALTRYRVGCEGGTKCKNIGNGLSICAKD